MRIPEEYYPSQVVKRKPKPMSGFMYSYVCLYKGQYYDGVVDADSKIASKGEYDCLIQYIKDQIISKFDHDFPYDMISVISFNYLHEIDNS